MRYLNIHSDEKERRALEYEIRVKRMKNKAQETFQVVNHRAFAAVVEHPQPLPHISTSITRMENPTQADTNIRNQGKSVIISLSCTSHVCYESFDLSMYR